MGELRRTPLHDRHAALGARMVPFAGYSMPVHYPAGVLREHLHTRAEAGLFDVSHMGQVEIRPRSGRLADAARALERLVPADILGLAEGRQRYALFTDAAGGILDDLMVANKGDHLFLVVNAARKAEDLAHLREGLGETCAVRPFDRALIALQGPRAAMVLEGLGLPLGAMRFMDVAAAEIAGIPVALSRSGYTGEDGFEIAVASAQAGALWDRLAASAGVLPVGLGARDSLRLEAGLCLYGQDIDAATTPVEAGLAWSVGPARRPGGAREGGFAGAGIVLRELAKGPARRRVGILPEGRAPIRAGVELFASDSGAPIGRITSGGFGPSLGGPVAMGYVPSPLAAPGTPLLARLRGRMQPVKVARMPFVEPGYKRV